MAALLAVAGTFALVAEWTPEIARESAAPDRAPVGLVLFRVAADEAEILTLGVIPEVRRAGVGRALLEAALENARTLGAAALFLEVAADNAAAIALYQQAGFGAVGSRKGYYSRVGGTVDALVLARKA